MSGGSRHSLDESARQLARGFSGLVGGTVALMVVGALVRANGAGLACPDWPLCFGEFVPTFDVQVAFEWGHRVFAAIISLVLVLLSIGLWRQPQLRAAVQRPLGIAWALLAVQIVLGGLTVILLLAPWTVIAHLLTGTAFCVTLLWVARDLSEWGLAPARTPLSSRLIAWVALVCSAFVVQLLLGGMVSSQQAGLACTTFPTCNGESLVPTLSGLVGLHVIHRLNAFLLLGACIGLLRAAREVPRILRAARAALHLVALQIVVGVVNVWAQLPVEVTALHSALAAALALVACWLVREAALAGRATQTSASGAQA